MIFDVLAILFMIFVFPVGFYLCAKLDDWSDRNRTPLLPRVNNEDTLESWHDAYDDAIREGKDEVEAVRRADSVTQEWLPREARGLYPNPPAVRALSHKKLWEHSLSDPVLYGRNAFGPRPGETGGMGSHENKDGIITFKWGGMTTRMTSHEWVRQGRPTAEMVINQRWPKAAVAIQRFQDPEPVYPSPIHRGR